MFGIGRAALLKSRGGCVTLAAALAVFLSFSPLAHAAEGPWTVSSVEGTAKMIVGGGVPKPVERGQPVTVGAAIATGADGKVVLARRDDSITVFPNSRMSIPARTGGQEPGVLQRLGTLLFRMESRESRDFEIETPYLAAAIKGTTFTVAVSDDAAAVEVAEGLVQVTANGSGDTAYVGAGQRATVDRDGADQVRVAQSGAAGEVEGDTPRATESGVRDDSDDTPGSDDRPDSGAEPDSDDRPDSGAEPDSDDRPDSGAEPDSEDQPSSGD